MLAFGGYLPFGLNHLLYRVPGYKTFRGLYRHQFEFTFAMAMLAGLGMSALVRYRQIVSVRVAGKWIKPEKFALTLCTALMTVIVAGVAVLYLFFGDRLATVTPRPAGAASLGNPEFLVPIICFLVSAAVLWFSIRNPNSEFAAIRNSLLVGVLLLDLSSYGHFFHWRTAKFDVEARLADPPAVQLIKSREKDFNSFRVMSYPVHAYDYAYAWPEDPNFDLLNQPNTSILRGLQSISGYDVLRPERVGQMTGTAGSVLNGYVQDAKSFSLEDRGFDLLNVKYLIVGYGGATGKKAGFEHDGVYFARTNFGAELKPGVTLTTTADASAATEIAIVSSLANSTHLRDGAPILKLKLHTHDGRIIERELEAGRDTSEWAYDRADVKAAIKHQRARVAEDFDAGEFKSHAYLGRLKFDRAEIEKIEWIYAREDASLLVIRASLFDEATNSSAPLANFYLPPERWHSLGKFGQVEVYRNLRAMPRAWFVDKVDLRTKEEILSAIRTGNADEVEFDPASLALIDKEDGYPGLMKIAGEYSKGGAETRLIHYQPDRIEINTDNSRDGFLVLSEIHFDGWKAYVDGAESHVFLTNYTLRGVRVPAGNHQVEFVYRPRSFRLGAIGFAFGITVLLIGGVFILRRRF